MRIRTAITLLVALALLPGLSAATPFVVADDTRVSDDTGLQEPTLKTTQDSTPGPNGTAAGNGSPPGENATTNRTNPARNRTGNASNATANRTRGPVNGTPAGVEGFLATSPLSGQQTTPSSLAGKLRVESQYKANTTVELLRNSSTEYTLEITVTSNATNVSFYLQKQAVSASQNVSNVTAQVDGEPIAFGTTNASGSNWIAFEVDHFSTRQVSFTAPGENATANGTGSQDQTNRTAGNGTETTPTNGNASNATANRTRGPVNGTPAEVEGFLATSPLSGRQTSPPSLAGKLRVESQYRSNTTVELLRNSSTEYTLAITVEPHATNVSFYLQRQAVSASQNISNVTAEVNGTPIAFGSANASGSNWIAFEVDHFSTREVSFVSGSADGGTDGDGTTQVDAPSGVPQQTYGAVIGQDGKLDRSDLIEMVRNYLEDSTMNGVSLSRKTVLELVKHYIQQP